jgi:hypothetical protein
VGENRSGFNSSDNFIRNPKALLRKKRFCASTSSATPSTTKLLTPIPAATIAMAQKSLYELSIPAVANVPSKPTVNIGDKNFEIRTRMITMVQASPFFGLPNEDSNAHLQTLLELCDTIIIKDVTSDPVRLCLFPFSLVGKAK